MKFLSLASCLAFLVCCTDLAWAGDAPRPQANARTGEETAQLADRWERPFALWFHALSVGPFGLVGASLDYSPARWVAIEAGGGYNVDGPQGALWPRARLPLTRGFAIGGGPLLGVGNYDADNDCLICGEEQATRRHRTWKPAVVGGGLLSIEGRGEGGFSWKVYGGAGHVLNSGAIECTPASSQADCTPGSVLNMPYLGAALGFTL
jgi:hypothetical protein